MSFSISDIPDQSGRTALVTGANSGLGFETTKALAGRGAHVIMTARDEAKGMAALDRIEGDVPGANLELRLLDLADLEEVRMLAKSLHDDGQKLDLLINNAGVMMPPRGETRQGFETQFGTNHLGHFALTLLLIDLLKTDDDARVVTVSSDLHRRGQINFNDLQSAQNYSPTGAYAQSKIANIYFGRELARKCAAAGLNITSVLAHPGYAATNLQTSGPTGLLRMFMPLANAMFAQSAEAGAWPTLYAATMPDVKPGEYYGPTGLGGMRGAPGRGEPIARAKDEDIAARLWQVSEELTGVTWPY